MHFDWLSRGRTCGGRQEIIARLPKKGRLKGKQVDARSIMEWNVELFYREGRRRFVEKMADVHGKIKRGATHAMCKNKNCLVF